MESSFRSLSSMYLDLQLISAITRNDAELVESLLRRGINVNTKDSELNTPLHLAVSKLSPNIRIVNLLINHGASVNAKNFYRNTPLAQMLTITAAFLMDIRDFRGFTNNDPLQELPSVWWSVVAKLVSAGSRLSSIDRNIIFTDFAQIDWKPTTDEMLLSSGIEIEPAGIRDTLEGLLSHRFNRKKTKKRKR